MNNLNLLKNLTRKCIKNSYQLKNYSFNYNIIISSLVILNLRIEKILFDKKNKNGNPLIITIKLVSSFYNLISDLKKFNEYTNKQKIKKMEFIKEKSHKYLFQNLWTLYSFQEYKKERIGRYLRRIKINNLKKYIKNKKIIDFGSGHGNFLVACYLSGAKYSLGIDYGKKSILFAKQIIKKMKLKKNKIKFKVKSVYSSGEKKESFDFAIQNGVFHHLNNETMAYKEVHRVLKPGGYFWLYTDGGGGIRDIIFDMSQKILKKINKEFVLHSLKKLSLDTNKTYHFGDAFNAHYKHSNYKEITIKLKKLNFYNFKQMNGGFKTDFDKPFFKDRFFKEKFGSGDLRILCQKKLK